MQHLMVSFTPTFFSFNAVLFSRAASKDLLLDKVKESEKEKTLSVSPEEQQCLAWCSQPPDESDASTSGSLEVDRL